MTRFLATFFALVAVAAAQGDWHACGTCKMGAPADRMAVAGPDARVIGVENLRIADASIMPSVPCANTNISTIMIGEKVADTILREQNR